MWSRKKTKVELTFSAKLAATLLEVLARLFLLSSYMREKEAGS